MLSKRRGNDHNRKQQRQHAIYCSGNTSITIMILCSVAFLLSFVLYANVFFVGVPKYNQKTNTGRTIPRIEKDFPPSADAIRAILISEQELLLGPKLSTESLDTLDKMARFYELTYAFVDAFQRRNIPILVGSGSHIGARRHHGERKVYCNATCIVLSMMICVS